MGEEHDEQGGRGRARACQREAQPAPAPVAAEPAGQQQRHRGQGEVDQGADHVVRVVMPGLAGRRGQQHPVAAQQAGRHGERAGGLDQPGPWPSPPRAAKFRMQRRAERDRAAAQHDEPGDHDPGIPGIGRGQAADLHLRGGMADLEQRGRDPGSREGGGAGDPRDRAQPRPFPCCRHAALRRSALAPHTIDRAAAPGSSPGASALDGTVTARRHRSGPFRRRVKRS